MVIYMFLSKISVTLLFVDRFTQFEFPHEAQKSGISAPIMLGCDYQSRCVQKVEYDIVKLFYFELVISYMYITHS